MKMNKKLIAIIGMIAAVAIIFWKKIALLGLVIILFVGTLIARPEITTDVSKYAELRSGPTAKENYQHRWGMDESIWPEVITENMEVKDYKMVYYEPWDAQYLGHLVVKYPDSEYKAEVERLKAYKSTEYKGYYDVTGESDYELLAINADPYYGFIYAMADEDNTIIYAEQVFCDYYMDLKYEKYMPKEYFLDGFDATQNSRYYKEKHKELDDIANE